MDVPDVSNVNVSVLLPFLRRRQVRGILIGSNAFDAGQGLATSQRHSAAQQLAQALRNCAETSHLETMLLFQSDCGVSDGPAKADCRLEIHASNCGWRQQSRLYWLVGKSQAVAPHVCARPEGWAWNSSQRSGIAVGGRGGLNLLQSRCLLSLQSITQRMMCLLCLRRRRIASLRTCEDFRRKLTKRARSCSCGVNALLACPFASRAFANVGSASFSHSCSAGYAGRARPAPQHFDRKRSSSAFPFVLAGHDAPIVHVQSGTFSLPGQE